MDNEELILFYSKFSQASIHAVQICTRLGLSNLIQIINIDHPDVRALIQNGKFVSIRKVPTLLVRTNGNTKAYEGPKSTDYMNYLVNLQYRNQPELPPQKPRKQKIVVPKTGRAQPLPPPPQVEELPSEEEEELPPEEEETIEEEFEEEQEEAETTPVVPNNQNLPPGISGGKLDIRAILSSAPQMRQSQLEQGLGYNESKLPKQ
jgi:hypothetical protein